MKLTDILKRNMQPAAWAEGERIPWDDPAISERILAEHLSQESDAASRPGVIINKHVDWIHRRVLKRQPARILDLGCGPGLYTARLANLGHTCIGIDCAPASIKYAIQQTTPGCQYQLGDLLTAEYGAEFDLIILIFGALNLFRKPDARLILKKACQALKPGGRLLLEISSLDAVDQIGNQPAMWYSAETSLFSGSPHLCLMETFWDEEQGTATERFYIIDAATSGVTHHAASTQGYTEEELEDLLSEAGFEGVEFHPSLTGRQEELNDFLVCVTVRPE